MVRLLKATVLLSLVVAIVGLVVFGDWSGVAVLAVQLVAVTVLGLRARADVARRQPPPWLQQ